MWLTQTNKFNSEQTTIVNQMYNCLGNRVRYWTAFLLYLVVSHTCHSWEHASFSMCLFVVEGAFCIVHPHSLQNGPVISTDLILYLQILQFKAATFTHKIKGCGMMKCHKRYGSGTYLHHYNSWANKFQHYSWLKLKVLTIKKH